MLKVLITVDTEVYPLFTDWRADHLQRDIRRDLYGETRQGEYGVAYQVRTLAEHGLKGVFFVEGLFASAIGIEPLRELVGPMVAGGHEVQLHLHPEWLAWMPDPPVPHAGREMTNEFTVDEQATLVGLGARNLVAAGAPAVTAFRAGDYAANLDTLDALGRNGIAYDSSYNPCFGCSFPGEGGAFGSTTQATVVRTVCEVPVSHWRTWPVGRRHAQLTAASVAEMEAALWHARRNEWDAFVVVLHSFELLKSRRKRVADPAPDPVVVDRFLALCRFLQRHRDQFQACGFNDLGPVPGAPGREKAALSSPVARTGMRVLQQLRRRLAN